MLGTVSSSPVYVPTINDNLKDFDKLFLLWNRISQVECNVVFKFNKCRFLRQNAVAFLGALFHFFDSQGKKISIDTNSFQSGVYQNLQQNGFMYSLGHGSEPWEGNSIPYRKDQIKDSNAIVEYLNQSWLGRDWINIDSHLQQRIISNTLEIYENAFEHGGDNVCVFSCGQYYPQLKQLKFSIVDLGVGIPYNVRNYLQENDLSARDALRWSFQSGHTTKRGHCPSGVGLDTLKQFVQMNDGKLEIFSHDGYAIIGKNKERYNNRELKFDGTLVNITFRCDGCSSYSRNNFKSGKSYF